MKRPPPVRVYVLAATYQSRVRAHVYGLLRPRSGLHHALHVQLLQRFKLLTLGALLFLAKVYPLTAKSIREDGNERAVSSRTIQMTDKAYVSRCLICRVDAGSSIVSPYMNASSGTSCNALSFRPIILLTSPSFMKNIFCQLPIGAIKFFINVRFQ